MPNLPTELQNAIHQTFETVEYCAKTVLSGRSDCKELNTIFDRIKKVVESTHGNYTEEHIDSLTELFSDAAKKIASLSPSSLPTEAVKKLQESIQQGIQHLKSVVTNKVCTSEVVTLCAKIFDFFKNIAKVAGFNLETPAFIASSMAQHQTLPHANKSSGQQPQQGRPGR